MGLQTQFESLESSVRSKEEEAARVEKRLNEILEERTRALEDRSRLSSSLEEARDTIRLLVLYPDLTSTNPQLAQKISNEIPLSHGI